MNVKVQCPCGKGVKVPESALGKPLKCPQCGVTNTYSAASVLKRYPDEPPPPKAPPPARTPPTARKTAKGVPKPAASGRAMDPKTKLLILGGSGGGVAALVLLAAILITRSDPP